MDVIEERMAPQARAAKVTYLLLSEGPLTTREIADILGYKTCPGVYYLMDSVSREVPILHDKDAGYWMIMDGWHDGRKRQERGP